MGDYRGLRSDRSFGATDPMKRQWKRLSSVHPLKAAARRKVLHQARDLSWDEYAFTHLIDQIDDTLNQIVAPFGVKWSRAEE